MKIWKGTAASGGAAWGYATHLRGDPEGAIPVRRTVTDPEMEIARFWEAHGKALAELESLYRLAREDMGEEESSIFLTHKAMLADEELQNDVVQRIREKKINAEYAVYEAAQVYQTLFASIEDDYLRQRAADLQDVSQRLCRKLENSSEQALHKRKDAIIIAQDLLPSQTIQLNKENVNAFLTQAGSPNSHAAILARTREIPAIVAMGYEIASIPEGTPLIVDGDTGTVYANPDRDILAWFYKKTEQADEQRALLSQALATENRTLDGRKVEVKANIGTLQDLEEALANGCDGVGLTRSEFLYMHSTQWPDEEQQFTYYRSILSTMKGRRVIIRTCDLGMDKKVDYLKGAQEENPALGFRGIRVSLAYPDTFLTQLRALLRASAYGSLSIMFPMIVSPEEVDRVLELAREAAEQLRAEGIAMGDDVQYGVMIETPAAAVLSDILAKKVDFFSIGTNDLVQYTLCADRVNPEVAQLYDPCHPAVLRLIEHVIENIHREGKVCGICGDAATIPEFAVRAIKMGIDSLSVPPRKIPKLRHLVQNTDSNKGEYYGKSGNPQPNRPHTLKADCNMG